MAEYSRNDIRNWLKKYGKDRTEDYIDFAPYDMPTAERRKVGVGNIFINQVRHTTCGWYIRSRNRHDYVTCICGGLSIDGGSWYTTLGGDIDNAENHVVWYERTEDDAEDEL